MKAIEILTESNQTIDFKTLKSAVQQMHDDDAEELLQFIDSMGNGVKSDQGLSKDKFGSMVGQLAGAQKSSTGGKTTQTPTGVKHTASPTNPNIQKPSAAPAAVPSKGSNIKITGKAKPRPKLSIAV